MGPYITRGEGGGVRVLYLWGSLNYNGFKYDLHLVVDTNDFKGTQVPVISKISFHFTVYLRVTLVTI